MLQHWAWGKRQKSLGMLGQPDLIIDALAYKAVEVESRQREEQAAAQRVR